MALVWEDIYSRLACVYKKAGNVRTNVKSETCLPTYCCQGKVISIAYSNSVFVALFFQHAMHMRHIILSSVACLAVPYFLALPR